MRFDDKQPLPVRTRLTVLKDAPPEASCLVFCEAQERSVPLDSCAMCGFGGEPERDRHGVPRTVPCSRFELRSTPPPPPDDSGPRLATTATHVGALARTAASLAVGYALVGPVLCVAYDVPLRSAADFLARDPSAYGVPVVDHEARFIGVLSRAAAALALDQREGAQSVAEKMALATLSIDESASLDVAFSTMGARRARELVVTDHDRQVVGTLRDLDALRFVSYVSRTGLRPPVAA